MDSNEIKNYLPHRYPFLFVDKITKLTEEKIIGYKNITENEPFFQGHFPNNPIMPGVLILEAMAQCGGAGLMKINDLRNKDIMLLGFEKAKFRKAVKPGDILRIEIEVCSSSSKIVHQSGKAFVDRDLVAQAEWKAMIKDKEGA